MHVGPLKPARGSPTSGRFRLVPRANWAISTLGKASQLPHCLECTRHVHRSPTSAAPPTPVARCADCLCSAALLQVCGERPVQVACPPAGHRRTLPGAARRLRAAGEHAASHCGTALGPPEHGACAAAVRLECAMHSGCLLWAPADQTLLGQHRRGCLDRASAVTSTGVPLTGGMGYQQLATQCLLAALEYLEAHKLRYQAVTGRSPAPSQQR